MLLKARLTSRIQKQNKKPGINASTRPDSVCKEATKEMPAKSFETDSNPQKVGSEQIGVKTARLQVVSRCERDLFRKSRNNGAGDWFFIK